jgi:hypothetical protein
VLKALQISKSLSQTLNPDFPRAKIKIYLLLTKLGQEQYFHAKKNPPPLPQASLITPTTITNIKTRNHHYDL